MEKYEQLFHVPKGIYLLNHSVGCIPKSVFQQIQENSYWISWQQQASLAWKDWLDEITSFKIALSKFLNCEPNYICPQVNVSAGIAKILPSLPIREHRTHNVISKMDFPSIGFALAKGKNLSQHIAWVEPINNQTPLSQWEKKLTKETQLVILSHATYGNSYLNPVADICHLARERGIFTIVDVTQSIGIVPLDIRTWNADFVVGSCIKWLCGGSGAGFLWVNPNGCEQLNPTDVGWFSHKNPFEFDIENFQYADDAQRFFGGTPSVGPYSVARKSLNFLHDLGSHTIRAHNLHLSKMLIDAALSLDVAIISPQDSEQRGGTVCLQFPDAAKTMDAFVKANIHVDARPGYGIRFSPHIYNTVDDIEAIKEILKPQSATSYQAQP